MIRYSRLISTNDCEDDVGDVPEHLRAVHAGELGNLSQNLRSGSGQENRINRRFVLLSHYGGFGIKSSL